MAPLTFIIAGGGYAGLATAIELARKNIRVTIYESVKKLTNQGDVIMLTSNATCIMSRWGDVLQKVVAKAAKPGAIILMDKNGNPLCTQPLPEESFGYPNIIAHRGETQSFMYDYAKSLGVEIHFNSRVTGYFEDDLGPGVVVGGKQIRASGVIATDGIHSQGKTYITGVETAAPASGFAVYRSWFPMSLLAEDPLTKHIAESKKDEWYVWLGPNVHAIVTTNVALQKLVCFCTHQDTYVTEESWSFPGKVEDMLKVVDGWDPVIQAVIKKVPAESIIDWKLLWRDPSKQWVSKKGGVVMAGDSAHPHLATSGSGAAQAIEDAATLGAVIDKLGAKDIPLAFKVFQELRFERTSLTQRMGWETRYRWHQTDWAAVAKNPDVLKMPQPTWLYGQDAEKYAYDNIDGVVAHIKNGVEFKNTNTPPGYVHEDWTVESMMEAEKVSGVEAMFKISNE